MNLDDLVRETLHDDRYALPGWPDASVRVRAGVSRRRRRRVAVVLSTSAVLAALAVPVVVRGLSGHPTDMAFPGQTLASTPSPGQVIAWQDRPASPPASATDGPAGTGYPGLVAGIDVASSAEPGSDLAYVVVLQNRSDQDISLVPCPVLTQHLGQDGGAYLLNCTIQTLPAHSWIRLRMRLHVSATALAGLNTLSWTIYTPDGRVAASATTPITVR